MTKSTGEMIGLEQLENLIMPFSKISGWAWCPECLTFGVPFPADRECGNCGKNALIKLYDELAVQQLLNDLLAEEE